MICELGAEHRRGHETGAPGFRTDLRRIFEELDGVDTDGQMNTSSRTGRFCLLLRICRASRLDGLLAEPDAGLDRAAVSSQRKTAKDPGESRIGRPTGASRRQGRGSDADQG